MSAKTFPIMVPYIRGRYIDCPHAVPWDIIAPHERQAQLNHGQSLERLAERGGLSPREFVAVMTDCPFREVARSIPTEEGFAIAFIKRCVVEPEWAKGDK